MKKKNTKGEYWVSAYPGWWNGKSFLLDPGRWNYRCRKGYCSAATVGERKLDATLRAAKICQIKAGTVRRLKFSERVRENGKRRWRDSEMMGLR